MKQKGNVGKQKEKLQSKTENKRGSNRVSKMIERRARKAKKAKKLEATHARLRGKSLILQSSFILFFLEWIVKKNYSIF